jgi:hypothetical protein
MLQPSIWTRELSSLMVPSRCRVCAKPLEQPKIGRKRKFCSKACARKDERRRAALSPQRAVVPARSEADSPRVSPPAEKASPRTERVSPRKEEDRHIDWWEVERLGLGSGGYWVGESRPRW